MSGLEETMEKAAQKDREAGAALIAQKRELEEKIKFFDNAITALNCGTFRGSDAKHLGAVLNLFENERAGARVEYESKFAAPQFGHKEPVAA